MYHAAKSSKNAAENKKKSGMMNQSNDSRVISPRDTTRRKLLFPREQPKITLGDTTELLPLRPAPPSLLIHQTLLEPAGFSLPPLAIGATFPPLPSIGPVISGALKAHRDAHARCHFNLPLSDSFSPLLFV